MKSRLRVVSNEELLSRLIDVTLAKPFKEIGPDLTVFAYAFNLIGEDGKANADSSGMDKLNKTVFDLLSIGQAAEGNAAQKVPMVITSTEMQPKVYGDEFTDEFCRRAGITRQNSPIRVLISTIQDPCVSDTSTGKFIPELVKILRQTVLDARATILKGDG